MRFASRSIPGSARAHVEVGRAGCDRLTGPVTGFVDADDKRKRRRALADSPVKLAAVQLGRGGRVESSDDANPLRGVRDERSRRPAWDGRHVERVGSTFERLHGRSPTVTDPEDTESVYHRYERHVEANQLSL